MNRELGAQAFAHGSDVYFGAGKSPGNNELTAHELTHVVQQTGIANKSNEQKLHFAPNMISKSPESDRVAKLKANYEAAVKQGDWDKAALLLNGFNDSDILSRLKKLTNVQLLKMKQGALKSMPGWSDRVTKPIDQLVSVVDEPVTTTKTKYVLEGPTTLKNYEFRGKKADAEKWVVKFKDGINIPIIAPKALERGYHNHTVKQAADAASYLPKANRSIMTTILLNAVVNPDDAYWAGQYNDANFHSYMTAGESGIVTIYPDKVSNKLPNKNYMRGTMIHETGHTWSYKTWGTDTSKGKWVDWKQAMDKDTVSVSTYATASIAEDVAETIQVYVSTKGSPRFKEYRQIVPNRFKILDAEYK
jgi:hypothetical protein